MGAVDSVNLYAFVGWGPHGATDPMGLESLGEMVHGYTEDAWAPDAPWWKRALAITAETAYATAEMASVGAISRIDKSQEAMERGDIDAWEYTAQVSGTVGRSAAVMAAGGLAGQGTARLAQVAGVGIKTTSTLAGAAGSLASKGAEDVVDVEILKTRDHYSSWQDYAAAGTVGAAFGLAEGMKLEPAGTYRDSQGRLRDETTHRFVDDPLTIRDRPQTEGQAVHRNSLDTQAPAEGYSLRNRDSGDVLKFGETTQGDARYSVNFLRENNAEVVFEAAGTKREMHFWQHDRILEYKASHDGVRPPLNKSDW